MKIIKIIGRGLFVEQRGWLGAALFFLIMAEVAFYGIACKLELNPFTAWFWRFERYMWPYLGLCYPPVICLVGWGMELLKEECPELYYKVFEL